MFWLTTLIILFLVSVCHVAGDPHILSFDKLGYYDFMGLCEYEIVTPCTNGTNIPWHITAKVNKINFYLVISILALKKNYCFTQILGGVKISLLIFICFTKITGLKNMYLWHLSYNFSETVLWWNFYILIFHGLTSLFRIISRNVGEREQQLWIISEYTCLEQWSS